MWGGPSLSDDGPDTGSGHGHQIASEVLPVSVHHALDPRHAPRTELTPHPSHSLVSRLRHVLAQGAGEEAVERYFDGQARVRIAEGNLEIVVASALSGQLLEQRFGGVLRRVAPELVSRPGAEVRFHVDRQPFGTDHAAARPTRARSAPKGKSTPAEQALTFTNFLVGISNKLAHAAAVRLVEDSCVAPPLFLHSRCGMGKSHLLHAVADGFSKRRPETIVRYATAEAFTNEFIAAIKANRLEAFRRTYRKVELLCLDDVHFFGGKEATQTELLHTLDAAGLEGARIVLASDEHPREIRKLHDRLVSRFLAGVVVKIDPPDRTLRGRLVRHLAQRRGLELEPAAEDLIADRTERAIGSLGGFGGSVREIEGLLHQVDAVHRLLPELSSPGGRIGLHLVRRALGLKTEAEHAESLPEHPPRPRKPIAAEVVIVEVCRAFKVEVTDLMQRVRHPRVVAARALVAYLCRTLTTLSFPEISRATGRDNHSTIITAYKRFSRQMADGETLPADLVPQFAGLTLREIADYLAKQVARAAAQ